MESSTEPLAEPLGMVVRNEFPDHGVLVPFPEQDGMGKVASGAAHRGDAARTGRLATTSTGPASCANRRRVSTAALLKARHETRGRDEKNA